MSVCMVVCFVQEGDTIDVKGPFGKFTYEGHGNYTLNRCENKSNTIIVSPRIHAATLDCFGPGRYSY